MLQTISQPDILEVPGRDDVHLEHLSRRGPSELTALITQNIPYILPYASIERGKERKYADDKIQIASNDLDDNRSFQYAVVRRSGVEQHDGKLVGLVGLDCHDQDGPTQASLSYFIDKSYQGRKIAKASARRLCAMGFGEWGFSEIFADIIPQNQRSQQVARYLGGCLLEHPAYHLSRGRIVKHQVWSITPASFERARLAA